MPISIPFHRAPALAPSRRAELERAIGRVLDSGRFVLGPEILAFESEFAAYCDSRHAIGVASGTDALKIALLATQAVRPGQGDEVITTALTAAFTALAIVEAGAVPVFADVDPVTLTLDPGSVERKISPRTRALLPVHLYGKPAEMGQLSELARLHRLVLIEDACQAHGATVGGRQVGGFGSAAAFSFYPTKNLGALGDGGAIVTNDDGIAERARLLRNGGQRARGEHATFGFNSRLDELQAAILRVGLRRLDEDNERRRELARLYVSRLARLPIALPDPEASVNHLFVIRSDRRDALGAWLTEKGVETLVHYPIPLHRQAAFRANAGESMCQRLPNAESACASVLSLPLYPGMSEESVHAICDAIAGFAEAP